MTKEPSQWQIQRSFETDYLHYHTLPKAQEKRISLVRALRSPLVRPSVPQGTINYTRVFSRHSSPKCWKTLRNGEFSTIPNNTSHRFPSLPVEKPSLHILQKEHRIFRKHMKWHIIENSKVKFKRLVQKWALLTRNTATEVSIGMDWTSYKRELIALWRGGDTHGWREINRGIQII